MQLRDDLGNIFINFMIDLKLIKNVIKVWNIDEKKYIWSLIFEILSVIFDIWYLIFDIFVHGAYVVKTKECLVKRLILIHHIKGHQLILKV